MEPIRIIHFFYELGRGGAETAIMNYYRHIDHTKVQFDFVLTSPVHMPYEDEIASMGGHVYRLPVLKKLNPIPYLIGVKAFLKEHPEYLVIHSHTSAKSFLPLSVAKYMGIPVRMSHSHSSKAEPGINGILKIVFRPLLKLVATDWLSCGVQAGEFLYGKKAARDGKFIVFNNVIEAARYKQNKEVREKLREELGFDNDTFVIGHTARFDPVKNHKFDVDLLVELKKLYPNTKLLEVGLGVKEGISDYARTKGVLDDIIFTGVVSNVWDYEQAMDVFILPSFNEGLPLSIVEAQVSGLPCFTSTGVSQECSVTELVTYSSLEDGANVWAKKIFDSRNNHRTDHFDEIVKAGYDANYSAKVLQEFYIKKYEEAQEKCQRKNRR